MVGKITDIWKKYPEHNTDSEECWCEPKIVYIDPITGNKVIVHNDFND